MRDFKKLKIWQKGFEIGNDVFKFVESFPKEERFGLSTQITRAGVSIASNIAEGSSRSSNKDYGRFVEISLGSTFELETQVLIALSMEYGNQSVGNKLLSSLDEEQKMLIAFLKVLRSQTRSS